MIQILVGVFVGEDHRDQGDGRNAHHVPGRGDGRTGQGNQASGDERGRTTEDGVGQIEAERESGEAHGGGERLGQVAGQGTVVGGQGGAHCQLNQQHGPELGGVEDEEGRNGENDERHASADEHLLAAEFVGDVAHAEHHEHVGDQADGGDGAGLGGRPCRRCQTDRSAGR